MYYWHLLFSLYLLFSAIHTPLQAETRGSSAPYISGDTFRSISNHVFDETTPCFDPTQVKKGDIVFVKTDWEHLGHFFSHYHPLIEHPYVLITHNSDHSAPGPFYEYLSSPKLLSWFAQNVEGFKHEKLYNIPIGIANKCWAHGNPKTFSLMQQEIPMMNRSILCYSNFAPSTYPKERKPVWDLFKNQSFCVYSKIKGLKPYLHDLGSSVFVLSPRGNGIDCHRTWEALLMGAIPIVRSSSLDPIYENLPVVIVNHWEEVTEAFLLEQHSKIQKSEFNLDKLYIDFWKNLIFSKAK